MHSFTHELNQRLNAQLHDLSKQELGSIQKAKASAKCVSQGLIQLRAFILQNPFRDELDEIDFFKTTKPGILSKYIYHRKVYHIESRRPTGGRPIHQTYLKAEIENLSRFQTLHPEFHQYYRTGEAYLDNVYFLRHGEIPAICDDDMASDMDPQFSTGYDYMVAKIIAHEQLSDYLYRQLDALDILTQSVQPVVSDAFKWTESKAALVELIYALYAMKAIGSGNCDISQLAGFFEQTFKISLSDTYRTYLDIKARSKPTKFIDALKTALQRKIEDEDD